MASFQKNVVQKFMIKISGFEKHAHVTIHHMYTLDLSGTTTYLVKTTKSCMMAQSNNYADITSTMVTCSSKQFLSCGITNLIFKSQLCSVSGNFRTILIL